MSINTNNELKFYEFRPTTNKNESNLCFCMDSDNDKDGFFAHDASPSPQNKVEHIFHKNCLKEVIRESPICPLCRKTIDQTTVFSNSDLLAFSCKMIFNYVALYTAVYIFSLYYKI